MLKLKSRGLGVTAIAAKLGCSRGTVYEALGEAGVYN